MGSETNWPPITPSGRAAKLAGLARLYNGAYYKPRATGKAINIFCWHPSFIQVCAVLC